MKGVGNLFERPIHQPVSYEIVSAQNNAASTEHYEKKKKKFGGDRRKVFDHLMNGGEITFLEAANNFGVMSLPKRIEEMRKQFGVHISDRWNNQNRDFKIWFMSEEDKKYNREFIKN